MANTFNLTVKAQNNHSASSVVGGVTHQIPDSVKAIQSLQSAVFEITGTSASNTMAIGASGIVTTNLAGAGAVTQKDPVTGANLNFTSFRGVYLVCERASAGTAPGCAGSSSSNGSTTSLAIGTGSKAFTMTAGAGIGYVVGQRVRAISGTGSGANWMEGVVASYSGSVLTVTVDQTAGSSTYADWTIVALCAAQVSSTGFGFTAPSTSPPFLMYEGSAMAFSIGSGTALTSADQLKTPAVNGQALTISLAGTTGLKVSVLALGS